jgi:DNA-binding Lrp family transcriptional regulator/predicted transcriptional regulator
MSYTLDSLDRQIIALLQRDGRVSNVEIARELGIAEGTVRKRLERLIDSSIIHVGAVVNPGVLSAATPVFVGVEVELPRVEEVAAVLSAMPEVLRVAIVAGEYDIMLEAVLPSTDRLLPFLRDRVASIPGVKRTETFQVLELSKWSSDWSIPEEVGNLKSSPRPARAVPSGAAMPTAPLRREAPPAEGAKWTANRPMRTAGDILQLKGHDVWWVSPETTVFEALELMSDRGIGAVLVLEGDRLVGVLSERDYARKVILHGKSSKETLVREIMTDRVVTVQPDTLVEVCMRIMTDHHIRHLPVIDGEKLAGMISIGDVVNAIIAEQRFVIDQLRAYRSYEEPCA